MSQKPLTTKTFLTKALVVLGLLAAALALCFSLNSCTKSDYKPDWDQVSCRNVYYFEQACADSNGKQPLTDSVMEFPQFGESPMLCGENLHQAELRTTKHSSGRCVTADGIVYYIIRWAEIK